MLWSALLIHLTGGRIETHFHVFASLGILAGYRSWPVLATATVVVAGDHIVRGLLWPESVYGIVNPEWWRFLEHAFWVVFAIAFLVVQCLRGMRDMRAIAERGAELEALAENEWTKTSVLERPTEEPAYAAADDRQLMGEPTQNALGAAGSGFDTATLVVDGRESRWSASIPEDAAARPHTGARRRPRRLLQERRGSPGPRGAPGSLNGLVGSASLRHGVVAGDDGNLTRLQR